MKRSEVNGAVRAATAFFTAHGWALPPNPCWDITDFGLGDFPRWGLVLINLAEEPEYCEKLMYAAQGQTTPAHCHAKKKEDIIVRAGTLAIQVWPTHPGQPGADAAFRLQVNRKLRPAAGGETLLLSAGERVTLTPGVYHEFRPVSDEAIIGEVSTANDDVGDNYFVDPQVGRFSPIDEDEAALVKLVSDP